MCSAFSGKRGRQCSEWHAALRVGLDQAPLIPPPVRLHWQACRHSAVSTSSQVARNSLASFGKNTSGGQGLQDLPFMSPWR